MADADRAGIYSGDPDGDKSHSRKERKLLHETAEEYRRRKRLYRRDGKRPKGSKSFLL